MIRVKKGNTEYRIPETELSNYLSQGYDLIDNCGNIITLGTKTRSVADIALENKRLHSKVRQLEEGITQRDATIASLKAAGAKAKDKTRQPTIDEAAPLTESNKRDEA